MNGIPNISQWIQDNIIPLILILIAAIVLWKGKSGDIARVVTIVACGLIGLVWLGLANTGAGEAIGEWVATTIRG
jgi:di/tricarboxylate transporter